MSTWELKEKSAGVLKTTIEGDQWSKAQDKAFKKIVSKLSLPGFRKGKVPSAIAKQHISSQEILINAVDEVATEALVQGIGEHDIQMIARPSLDIEAMDEKAVTLVYDIQVKPEVKLGQYTDLGIKKESTRVLKKDIEEQISRLQERYAELELKEEGSVENGDTAVIDFEGFKDGVAFDGGKGENYPLVIGSGSFIPGFEEQLIGMKPEETKEINVTFPENYQEASLAGQPVVFKVVVHEIKTKVLPEFNDELVKQANIENVTTTKEYEDYLKEDLKKRKENEAENKYTNDCLTKVVENAEVDVPQIMIDEECDRMVNDFKQRLAQQGFTMEQFTQMTGQQESDIRAGMAVDAENKVKVRLVLEAVAKVENVEISEESIDEEYKRIADAYGMESDKVKELISSDSIAYDLKLRKAIEIVKKSKPAKKTEKE
ncbi:trigger factor [uncultured Traorella sp.]|uniref:trigger factor n=1 Tax=uncultured Traorella sp. TaxID=1929048 RepID=UPI0025D1599A|nr:trigger factor [uncultured Traorella sp.]